MFIGLPVCQLPVSRFMGRLSSPISKKNIPQNWLRVKSLLLKIFENVYRDYWPVARSDRSILI
jgi:hypothetical protein